MIAKCCGHLAQTQTLSAQPIQRKHCLHNRFNANTACIFLGDLPDVIDQVDAEENEGLAHEFGVNVVPTVLFVKVSVVTKQ